ncbi:MAG: Mrp/NBP35 family ATP-binding protein [Anaerolineae bacterium]|nr:Mrp/NBP35 family ATP-binding protein [Anaerolineae bacterium]MDW8300658.1 Mrp/NBP35 family ATP-binding protein [Anaerolineae bacterium]
MSQQLHSAVMRALSTVIEPELHKDIVTLNMVRDLRIEDGVAHFTIMLTTPACPLKDVIYKAAEAAVLKVEGIRAIQVKWDAEVPSDKRVHGRISMPIRNVVAVGSGKGGVGKTTIAVNLAVSLAKEGARVGLMDADILTPNVPIMLGLTAGRPLVQNGKIVPFEVFGVKTISMGFLIDPDKAMVWRGPMLNSAIRQFFNDVDWGNNIDYMIVDLPPGTGDAPLSLAQAVPLTGAVIVSQPQPVAVGDALRSISMFEQLNVPIIGIVENMTGDLFGEGGGEQLAQQRNVPFLGRIPLDAEVRKGGDLGRPIVIGAPESATAQAFRRLARDVAARVSVIQLQSSDFIPLDIIG